MQSSSLAEKEHSLLTFLSLSRTLVGTVIRELSLFYALLYLFEIKKEQIIHTPHFVYCWEGVRTCYTISHALMRFFLKRCLVCRDVHDFTSRFTKEKAFKSYECSLINI
jgi:hypothetical protein